MSRTIARSVTRREVLWAAAGAAALAAMGPLGAWAQEKGAARWKIIAFSKPFQAVGFERTAEIVEAVGWDGIECPVRARGQVEPERVEEDLPRLVEALKKRGKTIGIVTTDVNEVTPLNERVLRTAAKLGIRRYRTAHWKYAKDRGIPEQLAEFKAKLKELAALNQELGMQAGVQNHSGSDYVGAPVWDIYELVKDLDVKLVATHFDIGHSTLEGGMSWPIDARLMRPFLGAVYVKDFRWERQANGNWRSVWCPLGEGMVRKEFFGELKKWGYEGVVCQHHEYFRSGEGVEEMVKAFKKDLAVLKQWVG